MAHLTVRSAYQKLTDRINLYPQGAPPSAALFKILQLLFSEVEAALVAQLPIKPFTAKKAARLWRKPESEAQKVLDTLSGRGVLVDVLPENGPAVYCLPPPMAGFFEFSLMRLRSDIDQKLLAELFYQYLNVEEEFIKQLFCRGETQLGRVFVHESALSAENSLHVLDYERAAEIVRTARHIGVGNCYCRHKMEHVGRACAAEQDICLTFNNTAASLTRHGIARHIDVDEGLDLLQKARSQRLVQFGENVRQSVNFICNCCGCCCEAMIAARRFGFLHPVHTSNFIPVIDEMACSGCGKCVETCPVEALGLVTANDPKHPKKKIARLNKDLCLGCAVCVAACPQEYISLDSRPQRVITPLNSTHRAVVMAIERGKLQNLIFDVQAHWNHRALAAILGVILKLPPFKQAMASRQMKSRYLEYLIKKLRY
ncbi:MAG: 4Fe-4S dicluster domain-containing protein [Chrysiogenales bacterium]|nr:4Fe-4S dicluster domain-containing protein [Candidatus Aminicenantes bacterium]TFG80216.1 MAG: 4Fe-4S dicluster domain-containing protein [Chrysiogenales bacterium]